MPDDIQLDQHGLERVTSRSLPAGTNLSADDSAERHGFLALGAALEAATGPLDEAALIAQLEKSCAPAINAAVVALPSPRSADSAWQTAFGIALAAAAVFALARIAMQLPEALRPSGALIATQEALPSAAPIHAAEHSPALRTAWLDPLDDEIALAQAVVDQLGADDPGVDGSLSRMNDRLQALSQELYGGSL